jgi:hypothetical protein
VSDENDDTDVSAPPLGPSIRVRAVPTKRMQPVTVTIRRCEVRNGRRYVDGVDQGPAQPETFGAHQNNERGAASRARRKR